MKEKEAEQAANTIKPEVVVPAHFGSIVGKTKDAKEFINELDPSVKSKILLDLLDGIEHITHATIKLTKGPVIYFDPIGIEDKPKDADMIFVTHNHSDHFSVPIIKRIAKEDTHFIATLDVAETLKREGFTNITEVVPNESYNVNGLNFTAVPAYDQATHLQENNWVGYIVDYHNTSYYIPGDTTLIPEIENFENVDVAFLPVDGAYTMSPKQAAQAASALKVLVAIPIHFGSVVGTTKDAEEFLALLDPSIMSKIMVLKSSK